MRPRTCGPRMPVKDYARTLRTFLLNLIVKDNDASVTFQQEVLDAEVVYAGPDFAVLRGYGASGCCMRTTPTGKRPTDHWNDAV